MVNCCAEQGNGVKQNETQKQQDSGVLMTRLTRLMTRCPGEDPDAHWAGCTAAGVILEKAMAGIVWNGVQQCLVHP